MTSHFIKYDRGYYSVSQDGRTFDYDIERRRINDPHKLLKWIRHMLEKTWFTNEHAIELIDCVAHQEGFNQFGT